jgi:hypothetical protein
MSGLLSEVGLGQEAFGNPMKAQRLFFLIKQSSEAMVSFRIMFILLLQALIITRIL